MNKKQQAKLYNKVIKGGLKKDPGVLAPSNSTLSEAVKFLKQIKK